MVVERPGGGGNHTNTVAHTKCSWGPRYLEHTKKHQAVSRQMLDLAFFLTPASGPAAMPHHLVSGGGGVLLGFFSFDSGSDR